MTGNHFESRHFLHFRIPQSLSTRFCWAISREFTTVFFEWNLVLYSEAGSSESLTTRNRLLRSRAYGWMDGWLTEAKNFATLIYFIQ